MLLGSESLAGSYDKNEAALCRFCFMSSLGEQGFERPEENILGECFLRWAPLGAANFQQKIMRDSIPASQLDVFRL